MSVFTGIWDFSGAPLEMARVEAISAAVQQTTVTSTQRQFGSVGMTYQAFDSGRDANSENQPHVSPSGTTVMWSGRLDNRAELLSLDLDCEVHDRMSSDRTLHLSDVAVVHALYDRFGVEILGRIVGDWALCIWDTRDQRLILACDFSGIRHLYYRRNEKSVLWSTDLKALVLGSREHFGVDDQYVREYLEGMPSPDRTPYADIKKVQGGHWIEIRQTSSHAHRYWEWNALNPITYNSDGDYQDHFLTVMRQSVRRRLNSDYPVVAELSGGLDSSSIVCLAHDILNKERGLAPQLHTLSFYHDEEPGCDERPYFSVIEREINSVGTHINSAKYDTLTLDTPCFSAVPIYPQGFVEGERDYWEVMKAHSARTLLSGIGGDEFLGGVPNAVPELADLLRQRSLREFASALGRWSIASRSPRLQLLQASIQESLRRNIREPSYAASGKISVLSKRLQANKSKLPVAESIQWISRRSTPSQRIFVETWSELMRHLAYQQPPMFGGYDRTYPYLDRDLLSFLLCIPRSQVIRAGERRSLMRRALNSFVPHEILWRKTKATSSRRYMKLFAAHSADILEKVSHHQAAQYAYIDTANLATALHNASNGMAEFNRPIMRSIGLSLWLRAATPYIDRRTQA